MSITIVNHAGCRSYGVLVRAYVAKRVPELSRFLAFARHGGTVATLRKARWHELRLKAQARRMRGGLA